MPLSPTFTIGQAEVQLSAARPVRAARLSVGKAIGPHDHDYTEICLIEEGTVSHLSDAGSEHLGVGKAVVVPPGPAHAFDAPQRLVVTNLYYLPEWFLLDLDLLWQHEGLVPLFFASHLFRRPTERRVHSFALTPAELQLCQVEARAIIEENGRPAPSLLWLRGAFSKLIVTLARAWQRQQPDAGRAEFDARIWSALQAIEAAVPEGTGFRVDQCARRAGLSPDAFARSFRAATGYAPSAYFQARRAQHAANLLLHSGLSITQIAARLGYADGAHLTRSFAKAHGCPPREFRKRYTS